MRLSKINISLFCLCIIGCSGGSGSVGVVGNNSDRDSSGNALVDFGSAFMPNGTGGYLRAGVKTLSAFALNESDEDAMGRAVCISITNSYPVMSDQALGDYVAKVGYTISETTPRADGNFVFAVLDTEEVGAYSGPDGYIMITRGAIAHMQDEAELAGVLGHEIGHVVHEDALNAIRVAKLSEAGAQALGTALQHDNNVGLYDAASDFTVQTVFKKGYDRRQELDADQAAVVYMSAAGYDPSSYQRFIDRIASERGGGNTELFATHPGFDERKAAVAEAIAQTGKSGIGATNADRFLAATASIRHAVP